MMDSFMENLKTILDSAEHDRRMKIAENMLNTHMEAAFAAVLTGLTEEEVNNLLKQRKR